MSALAIIVALVGTIYSATVMASDKGGQAKKEPVEQGITDQTPAKHEKLSSFAEGWGIDISGLDDEQIESAIFAEK